jgi:23S rRNA pseudouridine2605 synthase
MSEKLQKILAQAGLGSRREMERWIEAGRVQVNDVQAHLGERVDEHAQITVDGRPLRPVKDNAAETKVLMYHKPIGELCTRYDPEGRPTVFERLPPLHAGRWIMVGRLDYNTSGLLLFTNNGELANRLMHPSFHLTRIYAVRVYGMVLNSVLDQLERGVMLEDGEAHFDAVYPMDSRDATKRPSRTSLGDTPAPEQKKNHWYRVAVSMGRNRIVRRLWEAQSVKVNKLIRTGFGPLTLPPDLEAGKYMHLTPAEIKALQNVARATS